MRSLQEKRGSSQTLSPALRKSREIIITLRGISTLLILLRFISSYFSQSRLWGFNHLAYFSLPFRITITALGILVLLPPVSRLFLRAMERLFAVRIPFPKNILYLLISIFLLLPFWYFRSSTPLLGDGTLWIIGFSRGINPTMIFKEPLTILVHFHLFQILNRFLDWNVEMTYAAVSCLSGAIFIFILLKFLDFLEIHSLSKGLFFIMTLFMGSSQLFLGYLENYTLHYVALFTYIFLSMRFLRGRGSVLLPSLLFVLSIAFHIQGIILTPSLLFLFFFSLGKRNKDILKFLTLKNVLFAILLSLLIMTGIYFLKGFHSNGRIFVPLIPLGGYTLFSSKHLLDLLNQQFLLSSAGFILLIVLLISSWRKMDLDEPIVSFLILTGFYLLLFNFTINPDLGMARDWDLFGASGMGYTVLAIFLLIKTVDDKKVIETIGILLAGITLVSSIPWFLVNSDRERSVERFKNLLVVDRERSAYGYEILSIFYRKKGMVNEAIDALKNAIEVSPVNPRYYFNLGKFYQEKNLLDLAIAQYRQAIQVKPDYAEALTNLGNAFAMQERYEEALESYKKAIQFSPGLREAHNNIAEIYYRLKQYTLAWEHLRIDKNLGVEVDPEFFETLKQLSREQKR